MDHPWMPLQAGYSNDPPHGMYTVDASISGEPGHGADGSSILDQNSVIGHPGVEDAPSYSHTFDMSSTVYQAPLLMVNGFKHQYGHRGQNIAPQQDTGFDLAGSPSMGTSAQDPMTSLEGEASQLKRLAKNALEVSKELSYFSRSITGLPNGSPNRQRKEAIGGYLETLAALSCRLYNMLQQDCLKQYRMRSSQQAQFLPSPDIASSNTGRSAVDAEPLGSIQYTLAAHALRSNMQMSVPIYDSNAIGHSPTAANQPTSNAKEGKSDSKKRNKRLEKDEEDIGCSWHVPGKPIRGNTDWRILRDLAMNNPDKFIAEYPNDLHDDMLWLIAKQNNYNELGKFVKRLRYHHPGETFAAPPKPPQHSSKEEKKAWADTFKNRFCKALSRSGEKFGLTGKYKWEVYQPEDGWLDVYHWQENGRPKIVPYTKEEKQAKKEAKEAKKARVVTEAMTKVSAASKTSSAEISDERDEDLTFSEPEVTVSANYDTFQKRTEQLKSLPHYYDHYRGQAQQQPTGHPDLIVMHTSTSGQTIPKKEYLGESEHDEPPPTRTTTADALRPFPRDRNRSYKRKRDGDESHQKGYPARSSKYHKHPNSKVSAPQTTLTVSLPIDPSLNNLDGLFNENHDFTIATDDFQARRSRDVDGQGAAEVLLGRQQDMDGPLTPYRRGGTGHGGLGEIFFS